MKCALEIAKIKMMAEAEHEAEERRKDLEAEKEFEQTKKNAIELCETFINETMIDKAQSREELIMKFRIKTEEDRLGNIIFYRIIKDGRKYTDGTPSCDIDYNIGYAYDTFINYLKDYCFEVISENSEYRCYNYGYCKCHELTISVNTFDCII